MKEIEGIVLEKAPEFYPEFKKGMVQVRSLAPVWRMHRSAIYQLRISGEEGFYKDIVVKQGVYNPHYHNDVVSDTVKEFENLRLIEKDGKGRFRVVRALGMVKDKGLLFMERVLGERFSDLLKRFDWSRPSPERLDAIRGYFFSSGQWLKVFHESSATGKTEKIPVDESISEAKGIIENLGWRAKFAHLGSVLDQMRRLRDEAVKVAFPVVFKHGDFQLRNIIFENGQPVVMDVEGCCPDIAIHDICNFLIGLFNFNVRYPFSRFTRLAQVECATVFLDGYFSSQRRPSAAIKFHLLFCAIRQFDSTLRRNRFSSLKAVWVAWYYRDLFIWLTTWDIK